MRSATSGLRSTISRRSVKLTISDLSGEIQKLMWNNKNLADNNESLFLFGNGDGGGGPTPDMLEKVCPRLTFLFPSPFSTVQSHYYRQADHVRIMLTLYRSSSASARLRRRKAKSRKLHLARQPNSSIVSASIQKGAANFRPGEASCTWSSIVV